MKKLQVFVSSTYTDLKVERQAAVEAILTAGHIPAGMELFAAGDQSQLEVIKEWIKESDVYLLILGGRYGSIEPLSGKSYTELEYDFAATCGIPYFAVVISAEHLEAKTREHGSSVLEMSNQNKLQEFRARVLSKIVRIWGETKDIKIAIIEKLAVLSRQSDLKGWVRGSEAIDSASIAQELARLSKENENLRAKIVEQASKYSNGLQHDEIVAYLTEQKFDDRVFTTEQRNVIEPFVTSMGSDRITLLHGFFVLSESYRVGIFRIGETDSFTFLHKQFERMGLVDNGETGQGVRLTNDGQNFLRRFLIDAGPELREALDTADKSECFNAFFHTRIGS